jgi:hypothetical protein
MPANVCRFCSLNVAQGFQDGGADYLLQLIRLLFSAAL